MRPSIIRTISPHKLAFWITINAKNAEQDGPIQAVGTYIPMTPEVPRRIATFVLIAAIVGPAPIVWSNDRYATTQRVNPAWADALHAARFLNDPFPAATKCAGCHPDHYREWSVSSHAYAQLSPLFNALSNKQLRDTSGTLGDFCVRCHSPVRAALGEPNESSNLDRHPTSREGVTCVVCHRINQQWGKIFGRQSLVAGDIYAPVFGSLGNDNLAAALADTEYYGPWVTEHSPDDHGRDVHAEVVPFFHQTTPGFCGSCHDVALPNGFHLTDSLSEFKQTPAARQLQTCQDCHLGQVPGVDAGYGHAPAAKIGNVTTPPRKRTNHLMVGPSYSPLHPGIFPHNLDAIRQANGPDHQVGLATMREWLLFDERAGWGTHDFEENIPQGAVFPRAWQDSVRRYRARAILNDQFELLAEAERQRRMLLATGYRLSNVVVERADSRGIVFGLQVANGTDGHGVPAGAGKPAMLVFLRVLVLDCWGNVVFSSGDLDPNGDVRDDHSLYVRHGLLPRDRSLFSLQTRYLTRNLRGGEREQVLAINYSQDPLPFVRPSIAPTTVLGRPQSVRRHKLNIEPGGKRWARYHVRGRQLTAAKSYTVSAQLIVGVVPVNLVHQMSSAGFDYGLSAQTVAQRVVEGHTIVHERFARIDVHK